MNRLNSKLLIGQRFLFDPYDNSLIDQAENNELTRLGCNESRALSLLIEEPGAIITRTRLHNHVWREQGFEVDDSSLTQAISTLRKALKDCTKSPAFIKTVPKRGYQMIADVQCLSDRQSTDSVDNTDSIDTDDIPAVQPEVVSNPKPEQSSRQPQQHAEPDSQNTSITSKRPLFTILSVIACLIAVLLPLIIKTSLPPKSVAFTPFTTVDGVSVMTPTNQPDLSQWKATISQCVNNYLKHHTGKKHPLKVIASGEADQLWLNYIHSSYTPNENVTLRLLSSQKDNTTLCQ
ncbi:winged helix-turn-helix domain-containing protein [Photobacterium nomapromontoriensis]|uniref:winged helix-turn-helix domain-containing protein n=1 Tax=Photobacterium nomapromontoriensis TaxID=2910237 RepID=UPI003D122AB6